MIVKYAIAAGVGALLCYLVVPVKVEIKTVEISSTKKEVEQVVRKNTTIKEKTNTDGSTEKITEIRESKETESIKEVLTAKTSEEVKTKGGSTSTTVTVLGIKLPGQMDVIPGISVSRSLLGPLVIQGVAAKNGMFGIGIGLEF